MPIMALDILPARTEVSSLSGSDSGYKAQGTSAGKNDGLSFSEMLERAGQKDTTDGKVNTGENASDKTPASDAKPVEEAREVEQDHHKHGAGKDDAQEREAKLEIYLILFLHGAPSFRTVRTYVITPETVRQETRDSLRKN